MENRWNILNSISDWVKYSDNKASVILTVYGILITIIYTNAGEVYNAIINSNWILTLGILCTLTTLGSIYFAFKCINPALKNENPNSVVYFGHIANKHKSFKEYHNELELSITDESKLKEQLSEQIFTNSKLAWSKFSNVTWSIRFFVATIVILLIQILVYLITNNNGG